MPNVWRIMSRYGGQRLAESAPCRYTTWIIYVSAGNVNLQHASEATVRFMLRHGFSADRMTGPDDCYRIENAAGDFTGAAPRIRITEDDSGQATSLSAFCMRPYSFGRLAVIK
jgi:hypothetical protein